VSARRSVLIVNTKSRRGRAWFTAAQTRLRDLGAELDYAKSFRTFQELVAETKDAIRREVPLIIAGGGDGTFSAVARLFVGSNSTMGVLPLGTGNAFARDLGIPTDLDEACRIALNGNPAQVDLGFAANDYFLNVATVGVSTHIARSLTPENKRKLGALVYVSSLFGAIRRTRPFLMRLKTENGEREFETLQAVIGNGRFHAGPFPLSPDASLTEGRLTLYALQTTNKAAFLKLGILLPLGRHVDLPEIHYEDTVGGTLETVPSLPVTIDGEVCARTPLEFGIRPLALRVMTPESFSG
jgi:diacylglycerol kinase (ATP)